MAKFISDEEMSKIELNSIDSKPSKKIISDEEMNILEASQPSEIDSAIRGAAQGASFGFADEVTGGVEALWEKAKGNPEEFGRLYQKSRDESREKYKLAEQVNPASYLTGQVGGAIGTSFVPGLQGASIGKLALQGAAQGLGSSEADLTKGEIGQAAIDTGLSAGLGAGIGYAAPKVMSGLSKIGSKVSGVLDDIGESSIKNATGATGKQLQNFEEGIGRKLYNEGQVRFADTAENIAQRVTQSSDEAIQNIDESLKLLDNQGVSLNVDDIVKSIQDNIDVLQKDPSKASIVKQLQNEIENTLNIGRKNPLSLSQAENIKRGYQSKVNWNTPETNPANRAISNIYKDSVEEAALKANPELSNVFTEGKKTFGRLAPIKEAAERRAAVQNQSQFGNLMDVASAGVGLYGVAEGDPLTSATAGIAGRRFIAPRIASSIGVSAFKIADALKSNPEQFGKFAKYLQDAASRGGNSLAATHFILQQTNPEYQETSSKLFGEDNE